MEDRKFICPCYRHERDIAATDHCICHLFVNDKYVPEELEEPTPRTADSPWPHIIVYGAYWCTDTRRVRRFLNVHGIPYDVVDVGESPEMAQRVMDWNRGFLSTPTLDIEGRIITEPSDEKLADILGLG